MLTLIGRCLCYSRRFTLVALSSRFSCHLLIILSGDYCDLQWIHKILFNELKLVQELKDHNEFQVSFHDGQQQTRSKFC